MQGDRRIRRVAAFQLRQGCLRRLPERRADSRRRGPLGGGERALHVCALLALTNEREVPLHRDRWQRSVETRVAREAHRGTAADLERLLRGAGLELERPRPDQEVAQGGQTGSAPRALRRRERVARLREPVAGARQPVRGDDLRHGQGKGRAAREGQLDARQVGAHFRGVAPQIHQLPQRHGRNWIPCAVCAICSPSP